MLEIDDQISDSAEIDIGIGCLHIVIIIIGPDIMIYESRKIISRSFEGKGDDIRAYPVSVIRITAVIIAAFVFRTGCEIFPCALQDIRLIVIPATQEIYLECMKRGYIETFIRAGGIVSTPTCGPCLGGHMGLLAAGERCLSTTNRNFVGRMGHVESEVYLCNAAVAAASAIAGKIVNPDEIENMTAKGGQA